MSWTKKPLFPIQQKPSSSRVLSSRLQASMCSWKYWSYSLTISLLNISASVQSSEDSGRGLVRARKTLIMYSGFLLRACVRVDRHSANTIGGHSRIVWMSIEMLGYLLRYLKYSPMTARMIQLLSLKVVQTLRMLPAMIGVMFWWLFLRNSLMMSSTSSSTASRYCYFLLWFSTIFLTKYHTSASLILGPLILTKLISSAGSSCSLLSSIASISLYQMCSTRTPFLRLLTSTFFALAQLASKCWISSNTNFQLKRLRLLGFYLLSTTGERGGTDSFLDMIEVAHKNRVSLLYFACLHAYLKVIICQFNFIQYYYRCKSAQISNRLENAPILVRHIQENQCHFPTTSSSTAASISRSVFMNYCVCVLPISKVKVDLFLSLQLLVRVRLRIAVASLMFWACFEQNWLLTDHSRRDRWLLATDFRSLQASTFSYSLYQTAYMSFSSCSVRGWVP